MPDVFRAAFLVMKTPFRSEPAMPMRSFLLSCALFLGLSGCLANDTDRGVVGAAGGAVISGATGGSPLTGAVVGGAAGYFCRDLNVPGCRNK